MVGSSAVHHRGYCRYWRLTRSPALRPWRGLLRLLRSDVRRAALRQRLSAAGHGQRVTLADAARHLGGAPTAAVRRLAKVKDGVVVSVL